jgi:hypothetical protein
MHHHKSGLECYRRHPPYMCAYVDTYMRARIHHTCVHAQTHTCATTYLAWSVTAGIDSYTTKLDAHRFDVWVRCFQVLVFMYGYGFKIVCNYTCMSTRICGCGFEIPAFVHVYLYVLMHDSEWDHLSIYVCMYVCMYSMIPCVCGLEKLALEDVHVFVYNRVWVLCIYVWMQGMHVHDVSICVFEILPFVCVLVYKHERVLCVISTAAHVCIYVNKYGWFQVWVCVLR